MLQNGYAMIFLLLLAAGLFSLVRSFRDSWSLVAGALNPEEPSAAAAVYSTTTLAAADVPWVAQRLVLRELDEPLPEARAFSAWTVRHVAFAESRTG
jgi:hypothetical protein